MSTFVNLRTSDKQPFVVNAEAVSMVSYSENKENPSHSSFFVARQNIGKSINVDPEGWEIDVDYAVDQLRQNGVQFFEFEASHGRSRYLVNPAGIQAVEVFEGRLLDPNVDIEDRQVVRPMAIDVKGYGRISTSNMDLPSVEAFTEAVKSAIPSAIEIMKNDKIPSDGFHLINPDEIKSMQAFSRDMKITFNSSGNHLELALEDGAGVSKQRSDYLNLLSDRVKRFGGADLLSYGEHRVYRALQKFEDRHMKRIFAEFGNAVAAKTSGLKNIKGAIRPAYVRLEAVSEMFANHGTRICVLFENTAGRQYPLDMQVDFHTEKDASRALIDLAQSVNVPEMP